jgi:hypothetical protein
MRLSEFSDWLKPTYLLLFSDSFLSVVRFQIRFYRFTLRRNLNLLNRDVERHSWPLTFPPSTVNAFYLYSRNLVILILQLETDFMIFFAFDKFWINVVKLWKEHNPYRTSLGGCYLKTSPNWWSFRVGISESISSINGEDRERRPSKQII